MRHQALLPLAILLLSACVEPGGVPGQALEGDEEPISTVIVEPEPGIKVAENRGVLRGTVRNDAQIPIPGVFVALVGANLAAQTNETGAFLFQNLTPKSYLVRADKSGFRSQELSANVSKATVTTLEILLLPVDDVGAGLRAHVHDFWGDQTEIVIMDNDVDLNKDPGGGYGINPGYAYWEVLSTAYYPNCNCSNPPGWPIFLPDGVIILPGTGEIHTTITWSDPAVHLQRASLVYLSADLVDRSSNHRYLPPKPSGGTHVIKVNDTMADSGHQKFTMWRFWLNAANSASGAGYQPGWAKGSVHVKMVLKKAALYLEPPHADYWAGKDVLVLRDKAQSVKYEFPLGQRDPFYSNLILPQGVIVPPGSSRMRLVLDWKYDQQTPADQEHDMIWRVGNQQPLKTPFKEYHRGTPVSSTATSKTWEFDMKPEWTDAFYQKKSNWEFSVYLKPFSPEDRLYPDPRPRVVTLEVTVWKDPGYGLS